MSFVIDKQTISDLELFPSDGNSISLFNYYDRTQTIGGQEYFFRLLSSPVPDTDFIINRKKEIEFFADTTPFLSLNRRQLDFTGHYLENRRIPLKNNIIDSIKDRFLSILKPDNDYYVITHGIFSTLHLLKDIRDFITGLPAIPVIPGAIRERFSFVNDFISESIILPYIKKPPVRANQMKPYLINKLDYFFRGTHLSIFRELLDFVYYIDVLQSLSSFIKKDKYTLPEFITDKGPVIDATDCYHPFLKEPVKNSFSFNSDNHFCFLTGPNMSGKSTFLKTIAVLVYFSQLGLPVPAKELKISFFNGIFTSINLSDSLNSGLSHFYGEVKRIKEMATEIRSNRNIVVILDELFRGTNVRDAYEATKLIVSKLSGIKGCLFFISSHILEVAEEISDSDHIDFRCFESGLNNGLPVYDFKLKRGISHERVGLRIVKNENIESVLDDILKQQDEIK